MKPRKKLYLLKVSLVFILIESLIATLSYFLFFFLLFRKLYKYGLYIIYHIWEVSRYTDIVLNMFDIDISRMII